MTLNERLYECQKCHKSQVAFRDSYPMCCGHYMAEATRERQDMTKEEVLAGLEKREAAVLRMPTGTSNNSSRRTGKMPNFYVNSKGESVDVRTMATPHILAAMAKAERESKMDVRDMLFTEAGEREKPVWEVRERKPDQVIRYAMQQTNAEAWKFVKEQAAAYPNRFFVAHESDPL